MFCPQCGSTQPDELNFCKSCGANLNSVRTALEKPGKAADFDWKRTWVAEAMMTQDEKDRRRGMTPEMKRRREIKAGVITASSGVGLTLVIAAIMDGIIIGGGASSAAIAILSRLWIVGLIPIFVGLALIVNGVFISSRGRDGIGDTAPSMDPASAEFAPPAETNQLRSGTFSVTDETTRHLTEPVPIERVKTK
jgi:hypothetical protein